MTLVAMSVLYQGVLPARAQEQMAKEAQNPIARSISVPLENDFNPHTGINKEDSYALQMNPVVPFNLSKEWNVITRTIISVIQVPNLTPEVKGTIGLGDVNLSLFLSPAKAGPACVNVSRRLVYPQVIMQSIFSPAVNRMPRWFSPKPWNSRLHAMLAIASFIIHYLAWLARNRFWGHLFEMATVSSSGLQSRNAPNGISRP